jgi:hypothetical protein
LKIFEGVLVSNATFKGVRGGNPALRPVKVLAKVPCRSCGRMMTTKVVVGATVSQHACSYCVSQKPARVECRECGCNKGKTYLRHFEGNWRMRTGKYYFHKSCLFKLQITKEVTAEIAEERYYS